MKYLDNSIRLIKCCFFFLAIQKYSFIHQVFPPLDTKENNDCVHAISQCFRVEVKDMPVKAAI